MSSAKHEPQSNKKITTTNVSIGGAAGYGAITLDRNLSPAEVEEVLRMHRQTLPPQPASGGVTRNISYGGSAGSYSVTLR